VDLKHVIEVCFSVEDNEEGRFHGL
jgi:hypothetical protein